MQLHHQISTLKKGDSSMADFYHKFTSVADTLAAIDQPLKDFDLFSFFLAGLGSEYEALVTAIQQHRGEVTLDELYGDFLSYELRLANINPPLISLWPALTLPIVPPPSVVVVVSDCPLHQLPPTLVVASPPISTASIVGVAVAEAITIIPLALFAKFALSPITLL
jgi:hypothetical protein